MTSWVNVDRWTNRWMDGQKDEQMESCMPKSPTLKQVQQKGLLLSQKRWNQKSKSIYAHLHTIVLFVLRFYGPVNPVGSCRAQSVYLTTHLLGRLSPPCS